MKRILLLFAVTVNFSLFAQTPVQDFTLTNVADGSVVSLEACPTCLGVAIIFTSNACPYARYYTDRIKNLVTTYQGKIQFLLINSHQDPEEATDKMKEAHKSWDLPVPYLADKDQVAMGCLAAKKSPEVFLLKKVDGKHIVAYSGALDDNPQAPDAVSQNYLKDAIDKLLGGEKIDVPMVRAVGCTLKKK